MATHQPVSGKTRHTTAFCDRQLFAKQYWRCVRPKRLVGAYLGRVSKENKQTFHP